MHPILDAIDRNACDRATRLAAADQSLMLDYAALRAVAAGLAQRIQAATNKPRVGILAPSSAASAVAIVACWLSQRTPTPLNFLTSPAELAHIVRDADLDLVVTIDRFAAALAPTGATPLLLDGKSLAAGTMATPAARGNETAVVIYTSGTAGIPKGVCLSFDNLTHNVAKCAEKARLAPDHVFLSVLPQFHSFGFTAMTVVPLTLGATVWYLPRFSPLLVAQMISERRVTCFMAVASMYAALANLKDVDAGAWSSLDLAISGGEALPLAVADAFRSAAGKELLEGYGLTETSPVVSLNTPWESKRGSVGTPLDGIEVFATDGDGAALSAGAEGELVIRGPCVMQGYLNQPQETAAAIRPDGGLRTGDFGRVDADGYVHVTGRLKELIIIGGENVAPREIETALAEHPAVAEAAVIGARDPLRGESPLAFVVLRDGMSTSAGELRIFCRERLASHKTPREVRIVDQLPRGPTGKVLKRALIP